MRTEQSGSISDQKGPLVAEGCKIEVTRKQFRVEQGNS